MVMRALGFPVRKRDVLLIVRDIDVNDTGKINKKQFVTISSLEFFFDSFVYFEHHANATVYRRKIISRFLIVSYYTFLILTFAVTREFGSRDPVDEIKEVLYTCQCMGHRMLLENRTLLSGCEVRFQRIKVWQACIIK